jgi:calcineurin-like phosphoesterase family protein
MLKLYQKVVDFLKPEDKVYCLGDCGDRGTQPWETIKAVAANPQFIYLKGNHEQMLVEAMKETDKLGYISYWHPKTSHLITNDGADTLEGWYKEKSNYWINYLDKLPTSSVYINQEGARIFLSHAGFTPLITKNPDFLWNRTHIYDDYPTLKSPIDIVVHGHIPCQLLSKKLQKAAEFQGKPLPTLYAHGAYWYAYMHKVCLDCASWISKEVVLLNLDTFEERIFTIEGNDDKRN